MEQLKNMELSKNISTRKPLSDITFPIYAITPNYKKTWKEGKVLFIETESGVYVLDNKYIKGDTLGQRRLRIKNSPLYIPRSVIHTIPQLIKSKYRTFIDNTGEVFKYIKLDTVPLKYYKVKKIVELDNGCVLIFEKLDNPVLVSCRDAYGINYVGFLETRMGYIAYEYCEERKGDTWRKI